MFILYADKNKLSVRKREAVASGSVNASSNNTESQGGGVAHNNLPPYYALCYIMKL